MKNLQEIRTLKEDEFPRLLNEIPSPPKKLFYAGKVPDWNKKILCVVGSRKYTNYGKEVTENLISGLKNEPIIIVSGLAIGIDSIAHNSAIKNNLNTIAVPGSGLDFKIIHPQTNIRLAKEIIENGGMLMSEFDPNFKATQWSFPQRNRIMAGMSDAVLVIEAEEKSGTLITSRLATEYNRDVFTIPHNIWSNTSKGPHMLLRLGATLIRNSDDILDALDIKSKKPEEIDLEKKYYDCSKEEMLVINLLNEPKEKNEIIREANLIHKFKTEETQTLLSLLEIKGLIKETLGQIRLI